METGIAIIFTPKLCNYYYFTAKAQIIKFLPLEPLIGPIGKLNLKKINWVIVGGESGPGTRPILQEWVTDIRDQCLRTSGPFFFKQRGGVQKKRAGRILEGRTWDEMPVHLGTAKI
jgi:protein gp37